MEIIAVCFNNLIATYFDLKTNYSFNWGVVFYFQLRSAYHHALYFLFTKRRNCSQKLIFSFLILLNNYGNSILGPKQLN